MKKLIITKRQANLIKLHENMPNMSKLASKNPISSTQLKKMHNRVDTLFNEENSLDLSKIKVPGEASKNSKIGHRNNPTNYNITEAIKGLIRGMYTKESVTESYDVWETYGTSKGEIMEYLNKLGLLTKNEDGSCQLSKKTPYMEFTSPLETMAVIESSIKSFLKHKEVVNETLSNLEEESNYPFGAEDTSDAPYYDKTTIDRKINKPKNDQYEVITSHHHIAIVKDKNNNKFVFDYYDPNVVDSIKNSVYYDGGEITSDVLTNYLNHYADELNIGQGLADYEAGGFDLVMIDSDLKNDILKYYDKHADIVKAVNDNTETSSEIQEEKMTPEFRAKRAAEIRANQEKIKSELPQNIKDKLASVKQASQDWEEDFFKKRDEKNLDIKTEVTVAGSAGGGLFGGGSSGPFVGPMTTVKKKVNEEGIGGSGQYATPGFPKSEFMGTAGKEGKAPVNKGVTHKKTTWKDGAFVEFDDCTKLNNNKEAQNGGCSTGAVDNVVKQKKTSSSILTKESLIKEVARKTGRTIEDVEKIINKTK
jgi:hypothetical protein